MLAIRSIDMTSPMLLPGIRLHMDGLKDAYIVRGRASSSSGTRPSRPTSHQGNVINLDGKAEALRLGPGDLAPASDAVT